MLLTTTFVELRVVAGKSRTRAVRPHAVSGRPMLIHTFHAMSMPRTCRAVPWPWEVTFRTAWSWQCTGAAWHIWIKHGFTVLVKCERQSKLFAAWHDRETVWVRHGNGMVCVNYHRPSGVGMWATCPLSSSSGYHAELHESCYQKHTNLRCSSDISVYHADFHQGHGTVGEWQGRGMACVN
jgi:hypothetical protein